jgi:transposase
MFVRKKKNKSGVISVQVIDKSHSKYKVLKTIGSSSDILEVEQFFEEGNNWIKSHTSQYEFDFTSERQQTTQFLDNIDQIRVSSIDLLLGKLFDDIGFNKITDDLFRILVISRLCYPVSKLKTTDYLRRYHSLDLDVHDFYRYLDKLHSSQKDEVQQISYQHTLQVLCGEISIVFYDVTTLYFEIEREDDLRKTGFSKEGRHQNPQIVLGLLVSVDGYPLAYEIFDGKKFEGHTMLPIVEAFKTKYKTQKIVIIADSGLLSADNIDQLQTKGYEYILGARIKSEKQSIKQQILSLGLNNGESSMIQKDENTHLIISYSDSRARKDKSNRERGLKKLEKQIQSGKLTKSNINNRGYNKYLKFEGEISVSIDNDKFEQDSHWDGLKGYMTNTKLSKQEVIENYAHLWKIEKAFRISKHDLRIRPIFHRLQRRIEAHICIAFTAYKVYKELERQLRIKKTTLSPEKAIEIAKTIYSLTVRTPITNQPMTKILLLNEEQKNLADLFGF